MSPKTVFKALLVCQIALISCHLILVRAGAINPWEFGGYGMYTVPYPAVTFEVMEPEIDGRGSFAYRDVTARIGRELHYGGCIMARTHRGQADIVAKMAEQGDARFAALFQRAEFSEDKRAIVKVDLGEIDITRTDPGTYHLTSTLCGATRTRTLTIN